MRTVHVFVAAGIVALYAACGSSGSSTIHRVSTSGGDGGDDGSSGPVGAATTSSGGGAQGAGGANAGGHGGASSAGPGGGASSTSAEAGTAVAAAGSGGAGSGGAGGAALDPLIVDDMEDGDERIVEVAGRTGYWYAANDGTGVQNPGPGDPCLPDAVVPPRNGSEHAIHATGAGFSNWGAATKVDLDNPASGHMGGVGTPSSYDASAHQGVTFWARGSAVRFELRQEDLVQIAEGGTCGSGCDDFYGRGVVVTDQWAMYIIDFSTMTQRGFGMQVPLDQQHTFGFQFLSAGPAFDVWIDDVRFY